MLLVEDNAVNQRLAARLLEKRGHRVAIAVNGREAVDAVRAEHFDLVLMDVQNARNGWIRGHSEDSVERARIRPALANCCHDCVCDEGRCRAPFSRKAWMDI